MPPGSIGRDCLLLLISLCFVSSEQGLQFVTVVRSSGCPLAVFLKSKQTYLSPALCLTEGLESHLSAACPRFDPVMKVTYLSLPITILSPQMMLEVREKLKPWLENRTLSFLQPLAIRFQSIESRRSLDLLWRTGQEVGFLRVACSNQTCDDLRSRPENLREQLEQTESEIDVRTSSPNQSPPIKLRQRIAIANRSRILAPPLPNTADVRPAPMCDNLRPFQHLDINNESCGLTILKREDRKGHFVIEPTLCYRGNYTTAWLNGSDSGLVKLALEVTSNSTTQLANQSLHPQSPLSVAVMALVGADVRVSESLTREHPAWRFETLRLAPDGRTAELRVACGGSESCNLLTSVLVNLLRHIRWYTESQLVDDVGCLWRDPHGPTVVSYSMEEPDNCTTPSDFYQPPTQLPMTDTSEDTDVLISIGRTIVRRGLRSFLVVQQRLDGRVDFRRSWAEYENGFGDNSSFWIGLRTLASLATLPPAPTSDGRRLRVELLDWEGGLHVAEYANLTLGRPHEGYQLGLGRLLPETSSLVGDSLSASRGAKFSTRDADNDPSAQWSCSDRHGEAGWWFGQAPCTFGNPNGAYGGPEANGQQYAAWYHVSYRWRALRETRLLVEVRV